MGDHSGTLGARVEPQSFRIWAQWVAEGADYSEAPEVQNFGLVAHRGVLGVGEGPLGIRMG